MQTLLIRLTAIHFSMAATLLSTQLPAAEPSSIAYRIREGKTVHFDDARKAQLHLETVKGLGCEARMEDHGGHTDVQYRLSSWRLLTLADENTARKWKGWMKQAGFETLHAHDDSHDHSGHNHGPGDGHSHADGHAHGGAEEVLRYRLAQWQTTHTKDRQQAEELNAVLQALGCDVRRQPHGDHDDVVFRCQKQMHLELPSHQVATTWEDWLRRTGFQTQHVH